jgi:hypothetical protein
VSQTFRLVCHETKQKIWIGQGWGAMDTFYSGEPETMERLGRFLVATIGKPLVVLNDGSDCGDWQEYQEFEQDN